MTYAQKQEIKRKALFKNLDNRLLGKACDFYLNCDLGSFVDERLLDELDSLKNDILGGSDES